MRWLSVLVMVMIAVSPAVLEDLGFRPGRVCVYFRGEYAADWARAGSKKAQQLHGSPMQ